MKKNRESIIRINFNVNSQAGLLELPGPEYSSQDKEGLGNVRTLIQDVAAKIDHEYLVIDLSQVHFFGASFIGILVNAWDQLKKRQRRLAICGLTPACGRLIQVLRLDTLFDVYPTQDSVFEKISEGIRPDLRQSGQNRVEISEVEWDKNLVRVEFIGGDDVPVRSLIESRKKMKLKEALRLTEP